MLTVSQILCPIVHYPGRKKCCFAARTENFKYGKVKILTSIVFRSWRQKGEAEAVLEFIRKHDYGIRHEKGTGKTEAFLVSAANCILSFSLLSPSSDK